MRLTIDERPSRDVDLDVAWWDWLRGLGLWDSGTELDARSCGVVLGWGLVRRCCAVPGTIGRVYVMGPDRYTSWHLLISPGGWRRGGAPIAV